MRRATIKLGCGLDQVGWAVLTALVVALSGAAAQAQSAPPLVPLPALSPCQADIKPPRLPRMWRAVALMLPYNHAQIDIAEFVFDGTVQALRASVIGAESGVVDLLITPDQTYRLNGPREAPTGCVAIGRRFSLPAEQWLSNQARCVGRGPIGTTPLEWWKMPSSGDAEPSATWFWYRSGTRMPWRSMFTALSADPPIIGEYSLSYFPTFEPVTQSNLGSLRELCRAQAPAAGGRNQGGVRSLMTSANDISEAERVRRVDGLIPGFSRRACAGMHPYQWPRRFHLTAIMTPTTFNYGPYPTEAFYDWEGSKTLLTRMRDPGNPQSGESIDALLVADHDGYDIRRPAGVAPSCRQPYPGVVRPDWMTNSKCVCRGVLANNAALGSKDTVQVLSCPIEHESTFWAIYRTNGEPLTLRSTAFNPEGLTLADYYRWRPNAAFPPDLLRVPEQCASTGLFTRPNILERALARGGFAQRCSGCHLVGN
jgi:hypothetical protein